MIKWSHVSYAVAIHNDNSNKNNNSVQDKFNVIDTNDGNLNGTIDKT